MRSPWLLLAALSLAGTSPVRAAEAPEPADCIQEIKQICIDLQEAPERCLAERAKRLSPPCAQLLRTTVSLAETGTGAQACLDDMKDVCYGKEGSLLTTCILENKSGFSPACRDFLDGPHQPVSDN